MNKAEYFTLRHGKQIVGNFNQAAEELGIKLETDVKTRIETFNERPVLIAMLGVFPCWCYYIDLEADTPEKYTVEWMKAELVKAGRNALEKAAQNMGVQL